MTAPTPATSGRIASRRLERSLLVTALGIGLLGPLLVAAAAGATFDQALADRPGVTLTYLAVVWVQLALAAVLVHVVLGRIAPTADELLLPISLALTGIGLTVVFALSPEQAQRQVTWLWVSLAALLGTMAVTRDFSTLRSYRYLFGAATVVLLVVPMLFGSMRGGARLWLEFGPITIQPGELAKITLVLFLAGYLERRGEGLLSGGRSLLGMELPDPRYLGPVVAMWGAGMLLLVALRDLGTALLFFGTFIAMMYAATAQAGYVVMGGISFAGGAWLAARMFGHVAARIQIWLNPWADPENKGYQILQGLFAIAAGGLSGVGLGLGAASRGVAKLPAATTDYPFATICEELGFWGAAAVVALFLLWVYRALRVGLTQPDLYRALLAVGLGSLMAIQTMVILGGVTKLIPLTGITLPFISYGGSSLVSNFVVLALLLRCSEDRP